FYSVISSHLPKVLLPFFGEVLAQFFLQVNKYMFII
ncbi:hypothetical protein Z043-119699, partial [Arapaima gigas]